MLLTLRDSTMLWDFKFKFAGVGISTIRTNLFMVCILEPNILATLELYKAFKLLLWDTF